MGIIVDKGLLFEEAVPVLKTEKPRMHRVKLIWEGPYSMVGGDGRVSGVYGDALSNIFEKSLKEAKSILRRAFEDGEITLLETPGPAAVRIAREANAYVYANIKEPFLPAYLFSHQRL